MSLSQEQAAFLLDMPVNSLPTPQNKGLWSQVGSLPVHLNSKPFISKQVGLRP
jgi:hypothetical protein